MDSLFVRALAAFLILPGMVAFAVPLLLIAPPLVGFALSGLVVLVPGVLLLLACVREFYVAGRGTLAPWAPPRTVVVTGPYRWSRNPMYVAVVLVLCGWAVGFQSWPLAAYAAAIAMAFHVRVVVNEEPFLARTHPDLWARYRTDTPRWIGVPRRH